MTTLQAATSRRALGPLGQYRRRDRQLIRVPDRKGAAVADVVSCWQMGWCQQIPQNGRNGAKPEQRQMRSKQCAFQTNKTRFVPSSLAGPSISTRRWPFSSCASQRWWCYNKVGACPYQTRTMDSRPQSLTLSLSLRPWPFQVSFPCDADADAVCRMCIRLLHT